MVGFPEESQALQWDGIVNLSNDNTRIQGRRWYKALADQQKSVPDYFAPFWKSELFSRVDSPRTTGSYVLQSCEVEIIVDEEIDPASYELTLGARIFATEEATEFIPINEKRF